jgi:5-methylcytosine-specific restriction protein A
MPFQPPSLGRKAAPRKKWAPSPYNPDLRKRGRAGQRDRRQVLDEEPFCRICLKADRSTLSVVVDHIKRLADGGSDERSNKQALCKPCHDAKTASELDLDRRARRDA